MKRAAAWATRLAWRLPPETAHDLALTALATGLFGARPPADPPVLATRLLGRSFANPLGLAAGFDKNARAVNGLLGLGFGFVEVGTVTPVAQPGNPKPRLFRLPADQALINRLGFNNDGAQAMAARLARLERRPGLVGINIGCNKNAPDPIADYCAVYRRLAPYADYVTINVSSPNTPGLRALQAVDQLAALIAAVRAESAAGRGGGPPPILVKVAPDLGEAAVADIAAFASDGPIDGLIVSNTTTARPHGLQSRRRDQTGGLSGRPLFAPATRLLAQFHRLTRGRVALVGVGGVFDGRDAYQKIKAGASLVQLYTGFVYEGPAVVARIKDQLTTLLAADGFDRVADAVGTASAEIAAAPTP